MYDVKRKKRKCANTVMRRSLVKIVLLLHVCSALRIYAVRCAHALWTTLSRRARKDRLATRNCVPNNRQKPLRSEGPKRRQRKVRGKFLAVLA